MDTGKTRSGRDVLSSLQYASSTLLASTVRSILLYKSGIYATKNGKPGSATNAKILDFVKKNEEIHEVINFGQRVYSKFRYLGSSQIGLLYWIFSEKNQEDVDIFFDQLSTGIDLKADSPVRILRERLLKESIVKRKLQTRDKIAICIIAWNYFRSKKPCKVINYNSTMDFPKPL